MPKDVCKTIKDENTDLVQDGLNYLQKAVSLRPNYDDAMQYLNLLYRRKADTDCPRRCRSQGRSGAGSGLGAEGDGRSQGQ